MYLIKLTESLLFFQLLIVQDSQLISFKIISLCDICVFCWIDVLVKGICKLGYISSSEKINFFFNSF